MNKIEIAVQHYAPSRGDSKIPDRSKIWVNVNNYENGNKELIGSGYITNPFSLDYFGSDEEFSKETFTGSLVKTVVMEHSNGGRSNNKQYSSLAEYLADPVVKESCREYITGGVASVLSRNGGDPDKIDYITTWKFDQFPEEFTTSYSCWDKIIPQEWLNEFNAHTIVNLSKCSVWPNAARAISESQVEEDLFGDRLFPVLKAPIELTGKMQDICYGFRSFSDPLTDSEFVYIGIRSKKYEIDTINEIYEAGGWILCDQQWDW